MAEATGLRNNALPYPVYGVPYGVSFAILDADGDLVTGATGLDSEVSKNGDTFADCTNEAIEIATSSGVYYLLLTGTEMTADVVTVIVKTGSSGAKTTLITLYPRKLVALRSGTAQGGAAGYITLDASAGSRDDRWNGCLCVATIDTLVEARIITDYTGSNQQAAVTPNWNVTPDSDDTFILYLPEGMQAPTVNVSHITEQSQTARDIGASVLLSSGTGTGQLDFTSGVVKANATQFAGQTITCASGVTIYPAVGMSAAARANVEVVYDTDFAVNYNTTVDKWEVDITHANGTAVTASGGRLEVDTTYWGGVVVGSAVIQVDLDTIKGQSITCAAPVTIGVYVGGTGAAALETTAQSILTDTAEIGAAGAGLTALASATDLATVDTNVDAIKAKTDQFVFTVANQVDANALTGGGGLSEATLTKYIALLARKDSAIATDLATELGNINQDFGTGTGTYANANDALEALRDQGDLAWITATGFSTHTAADVATAFGFTGSLDTLLADLPTVSEFEARTLPSADYFDPAADTVANVTTVATLTGHTPQTADVGKWFVRSNTAQSGSTSTTIKLDASASATNNLYRGLTVLLTGGTGAGQARTITGYNGTTKIANVDRAWITTPDNTSTFTLLGNNSPSLNATLQVSTAAASATIRTGTAQTGSTSNTIKLDTGASATDSVYVGNVVSITSGTGLGQTRTIVSYNGTTKVATVDRNWTTTPSNTSVFAIVANINPTTFSDQGVAQAGASGSITLAATASATDDIYNGSIVTILSGTAAGETSEITDYNGTTKVATVSPNFGSTPDSTSAYAVIPTTSGTGATVGDVPTATQIRIEMDTNSTQLAAILDDTGTAGVVVASGSKTGYSLASTGLDSISTTAPSGVASNFREMLVQVWRRFFKKTVYDNSANTIKTYADDGTTIVTTQTATSAAGVETQGPAT